LRVDLVLGAFGLALLAVAAGTVVLGVRRSWRRARGIAAWTFWLSAGVQMLAWFAVPFAVVHEVVATAGGDASSKARILAETISEGMNCTASLLLASPIAAVTWVVAVWQTRKARRGQTSG